MKAYVAVVNTIILVLVIVAVFYLFSNHILLVKTCAANQSLFSNSSSVYCVANGDINLILGGNLVSYTPNSSVAVYNYSVKPLEFKFVGGSALFNIWNQPSLQQSDSFAFLTIPDTFKVHMQYTSSSPTEFLVMSNQQYVNWVNGGYRTSAVELSVTGSNISAWFNDSTGCAGYVAVIKSLGGGPFTIYPNETILYDPAPSPTGICA